MNEWRTGHLNSPACGPVTIRTMLCSVMSDSLRLYRLWPARLLFPWNFPGKKLECVAFPIPGDPPHTGIRCASPASGGRFFTIEPPGKPNKGNGEMENHLPKSLLLHLVSHTLFHHGPEKGCPSVQFSSVQSLSRVQLFATSWTAACQASLSITNSGVHSNSCPSSQWCHPAISSSVVPFSSCPQSLPHQILFQWVNSSHEVAKVLEFQL